MSELSRGVSWLVSLAALVIIIAGLKAASEVVVPLMLSAFIAIICAPMLSGLRKKSVPTWLAILLIVTLIILSVSSLGVFVGASLDGFNKELPNYKLRMIKELDWIITLGNSLGLHVSEQQVRGYFDPSVLMQMVANTLSGLGNVLTNTFLVIMTVVFMLFEAADFPAKLSHALGDARSSLKNFKDFANAVNRYLAIKTSVSILTGCVVSLWLFILGVDFPILWGVSAFLLNFVPNIGSIIAAIPAVMLAFVQLGGFAAGLTGLGFIVINLVVGNIIEPRYMGKGLGLSTLVVFLSLLLWGWVFGPVGMLLSIPLTIIVKIAMEANPKTHWVAVILDGHRD
ncbi:AI-2E family transporter [Marinomonas sp. 15G1-11]|uniref:AI-2E family transporter n=1 Tax=Marinomonas phaeophyticola TaxID=3004091 RepID=A0ABT4JXI6_9GAMM|nr:AI-2E family transporter [Marinomonas sp. 15G1-11]MCZ2722940.1 AI-2E family transporter [Marinomonas sp. 15G1-11]